MAGARAWDGEGAFVLDWLRTPRGKASATGVLHHLSPSDLVVTLQKELVRGRGLRPDLVDDVILGVASQVDEQGANLARTATLLAGWGAGVPAVTVNRFCASGIDAVAQAAARVRAGDAGLIVAGGVESVSRVPIFSDRGPLWSDPATVAAVGSVHMGVAADLNATVDGWSREALDRYALETHAKAAAAWGAGFFDRSVVSLPGADGIPVTADELVRPHLTLEALAALPPLFAQLGAEGQDDLVARHHPDVGPLQHRHTVGTSPQMADASALLVVGSRDAAEQSGIAPRARIVASATAGVDPVVMLTAGQVAVERVLARAGLRREEIDVFEFAEAFSALCLRFRRDLDAGPDRLNPNGGTIAMGHAFGATGAILVGQCIDELEDMDARYGVAAVSGAAGLGVAVLLERVAG